MERTHKDIIGLLGGYRAVADSLGQQHQTVHNWTRRGIPARFWPAIARMAANIPDADGITVDALERASSAEAA